VSAWCCGTVPKIVENSIEPNVQKVSATPSAKPRSPMRLTMNALIAAAQALGR